MTTEKLMQLALERAGLESTPSDSTISVPGESIEKLAFGIDMETAEVLVAKELGVDLVVSHHPKADTAVTNFYEVMEVQIDRMVEFGVPINRAQKVLRKKMKSVELSNHVANYDRVSSACRALGMPFMNVHMPADRIGQEIVQNLLDETFADRPKATLGDVVETLKSFDVYREALSGPVIRVGSEKDYAGRIAVLFAGGTNGGADVFKAYFDAGVGTIVCMHVPEDVKKAVEEQNIGNIIVAGHMASDSIGINAIIDVWEKAGVEVIKMSGIL